MKETVTVVVRAGDRDSGSVCPMAPGPLCHLCHISLIPDLSSVIKITSTMPSTHTVHHRGCYEVGGKILEGLWRQAAIEYNHYYYNNNTGFREIHSPRSSIHLII